MKPLPAIPISDEPDACNPFACHPLLRRNRNLQPLPLTPVACHPLPPPPTKVRPKISSNGEPVACHPLLRRTRRLSGGLYRLLNFSILRVFCCNFYKVNQEISPVVMTVISCLVPILQHAEGLNKSLIENSAITLGRLASVCPELVSPHMEHFMQSWCIALAMIQDDIEKEDAFRGLCAMVKANPSGALSSLVFLCRAIASWHEIRSEELHNEVSQVLLGYKQHG